MSALDGPVTNDLKCNCDKCGRIIQAGEQMWFIKPMFLQDSSYVRHCFPFCQPSEESGKSKYKIVTQNKVVYGELVRSGRKSYDLIHNNGFYGDTFASLSKAKSFLELRLGSGFCLEPVEE